MSINLHPFVAGRASRTLRLRMRRNVIKKKIAIHVLPISPPFEQCVKACALKRTCEMFAQRK